MQCLVDLVWVDIVRDQGVFKSKDGWVFVFSFEKKMVQGYEKFKVEVVGVYGEIIF